MTVGRTRTRRVISPADFVSDVRISAVLEAQISDCIVSTGEVDRDLAVEADSNMLFEAPDFAAIVSGARSPIE
jgi:hypothetical protein